MWLTVPQLSQTTFRIQLSGSPHDKHVLDLKCDLKIFSVPQFAQIFVFFFFFIKFVFSLCLQGSILYMRPVIKNTEKVSADLRDSRYFFVKDIEEWL